MSFLSCLQSRVSPRTQSTPEAAAPTSAGGLSYAGRSNNLGSHVCPLEGRSHSLFFAVPSYKCWMDGGMSAKTHLTSRFEYLRV